MTGRFRPDSCEWFFILLERPVWTNEVAGISIRMLLQVILMVILRQIKYARRLERGRHPARPFAQVINGGDDLFRHLLLFNVLIENGRTVLRSAIIALAIKCGRIVNLEKE